MDSVIERRTTQAVWIFDLEDRYVREQRRRSRSFHPRPIEPVKFWLVGEVIAGVPTPYSQPLEMIVVRNPSGYYIFFGNVKLPSTRGLPSNGLGGGRRIDHIQHLNLADGIYSVRVAGPNYQEQQRDDIAVPMPNPNNPASATPFFFDLAPGHAYPFPEQYPWRPANPVAGCPGAGNQEELPFSPTVLRGNLFSFDGQPVKGAKIGVAAAQLYEYTTDEKGQWILVFDRNHRSGPVVVRIEMPNGGVVNVPNVCVIKGRETTLQQTALRGWVQRNGIGVPGAAIAITGQPQPITTQPDGSWTYNFALTQANTVVDVAATLPDGALNQVRPAIQVRSRTTTVVEPFRF